MTAATIQPGAILLAGYLDREAQNRILADIQAVLEAAPLYRPRMPKSGKPLSVRMSNCGPLGWVTDEAGYRYQPTHPETGRPWPAIPHALLTVWRELAANAPAPECCLINHYDGAARMGLHQDKDEDEFHAPVVSLSLGDTCLFRLGGRRRSDPTRSIRLSSGDALVLAGDARLAFHGVDRIMPGTSTLLSRSDLAVSGWPQDGRINLTLRRVTRAT
jgi:alkylated DNA repair protein (DNA oxidative demethylase)